MQHISFSLLIGIFAVAPVDAQLSFPLKNSHVETVKGDVNRRGGCQFHVHTRLRRSEKHQAIGHHQLGPARFTGDTCEVDLEVGQVDERDVLAIQKRIQAQKATNSDSAKEGSDVQPLYFQGASATSEAWFLDPINLVVNSVQSHIQWTYDLMIPEVNRTAIGSFHWTKLTASGWLKDWVKGTMISGYPDYMTYRTSAAFNNPIFCGGNITYANYYWVDVTGDSCGDTYCDAYAAVSGSLCSGLLTFHTYCLDD